MIRAARAASSVDDAAAAAQAVLDEGGGAVDAVIAGFFAAAGTHPGVLLAPSVALVAGFGSGGRIFDGRAAQPGRGAARPRGFVEESTIPAAARVSAPRNIGMLMLLSSYRGKATLSELCRAGVATAESAGAKARAKLIRRVGAAGVLALRAPEVQSALLAVGGAAAGGALTAGDLEDASPAQSEAAVYLAPDAASAGLSVYTPPFPGPMEEDGDAEAVVACDGRGVIAALAFVPARNGIAVPALEITLGRDAIPVRRGVTRVAPGTVLPAPAPIAIAVQFASAVSSAEGAPAPAHAAFSAAVALLGGPRLDPAAVAELARGAAVETALAELRERSGARAAAAVVSDGKTARSLFVG